MTTGCVLVTGASTGIGRAGALALEREGFHVLAGVRSEAAAGALRELGSPRLEPIVLDVTEPEQISRAVRRVAELVGTRGLAGLVNNAGVAVNAPVEFLPLGELRRLLEVNLVGVVALTQALTPLLRLGRGRIVLTGSTNGFIAAPTMAAYCMSKFALEALADCLRLELRPWSIHVSLLEPGAIATPIWDKSFAEAERLLASAPPELTALYGPLVEGALRLARDHAAKASPVDAVARALVHALTARRPRARYLVGHGAVIQRALSLLPASIKDHLVGSAFGVE